MLAANRPFDHTRLRPIVRTLQPTLQGPIAELLQSPFPAALPTAAGHVSKRALMERPSEMHQNSDIDRLSEREIVEENMLENICKGDLPAAPPAALRTQLPPSPLQLISHP